jgi:hypothetical protein
MAQAQGILSSAVRAVEGVPRNSHHGNSIETGDREVTSLPILPPNTGPSNPIGVLAKTAGVSERGNRFDAPVLLVDRWVIQNYRGEFLRTYTNHGIRFTEDLPKARLFQSAGVAKSVSLVLNLNRVQRVLVDAAGGNVRVALTHNPSTSARSLI